MRNKAKMKYNNHFILEILTKLYNIIYSQTERKNKQRDTADTEPGNIAQLSKNGVGVD